MPHNHPSELSFTEGDAAEYLEELRPYVEEIEEELLEVSHRIHEKPEVRFEEEFASGLLSGKLEEHGFRVERGVAGLPTAFSASASNLETKTGEPSSRPDDEKFPTIAVFCEYDALEGLGHGCGHNIIASTGLGAAIAVKRWLGDHPETPGRLVALGSPGEEGGGGKAYMIEAGYLEGVDAALMIHPAGENRGAKDFLARVSLDVTFTGKPAHAAAAPYEGVNALDAANLTLVAIGLLRQQIRPDSRVHAIITDGGQAPNIIPERSALRMYVRSPDNAYLKERLLPAVENCARGAALATGAEVEIVRPVPAYESLRTNGPLVELSEANLRALGREVAAGDAGGSGSTDMGNVSQVVPSSHPYIELVPVVALHTKETTEAAASAAGDKAVIDGALELAMTAVELLCRPELRAAVKQSFDEGT